MYLRLWLKPAAALTVVAALVIVATLGIHIYRYRFVRTGLDLVGLLPNSDATVFFVNIAALRQARLLGLFTQTQRVDDPEYKEFVRQTSFSYETDLDTIAGAADGKNIFFALQGRFDWLKLRDYAKRHNGECHELVCNAPTSKPGRWASFWSIQPDVMALAISDDRNAALAVSPHGHQGRKTSDAPLWVMASHALLKDPLSLPLALRIFAISLESADSVVLSVFPNQNHPGDLEVRLQADFPNKPTAESTRNQLEIQTKMLKLELSREHKQPNPADLSGVMTAGVFQVADNRVNGVWPVHQELLKSLE